MNFIEFIDKMILLNEKFNQAQQTCDHELKTTWALPDDIVNAPLNRKCKFCDSYLIMRGSSFTFKGVVYALPYCEKCNTIFEDDVNKIINDWRESQ